MRNVKAALEKSQQPRQADLARGDRDRQQHGRAGPARRPHRLEPRPEGRRRAGDPGGDRPGRAAAPRARAHDQGARGAHDAAGDLLAGQGGDGPQPARVLPAPADEGDPVGARRGQRARRGDRGSSARRRGKAKMPKPVLEEVERQLKKLERMHPDSAETATLRNWLDWMVTLPWGKVDQGQPRPRARRRRSSTRTTTGSRRSRSASSSTWRCASSRTR